MSKNHLCSISCKSQTYLFDQLIRVELQLKEAILTLWLKDIVW